MTKRVRTTRRLEVWLKDTSVPLFVLNSQRRLVFFNAGCEQLTGWPPAEVLGQVCDFVTESDLFSPAALLAALAPPANVWQGESIAVTTRVARHDSDPIEAILHFFPLTDAAQRVQATLGIIQLAPHCDQPANPHLSLQLHAELAELRQSLINRGDTGMLIGKSLGMQRLLSQLQLARQSTLPILLIGEAGTGRESLARQIHQASSQGTSTFVPLDCRRLPPDHLEATIRRMQDALQTDELQPGTIYLEHVEALPRDLQRLVLEVVKSQRHRVIASTLNSLEPLVESQDFVEPLFFALTPLTMSLPPLRNRPEDLALLSQYFLEELNRGAPQQVTGFQEQVLEQFGRYQWPGNVRELRSVIVEARQECTGPLIEIEHLPFRFRTGVRGQSVGPPARPRTQPLDPLLLRIEREQIELALDEAHQNKAKAAELLGITRPRLYRRMEVLGILDRDLGSESSTHDTGDPNRPAEAR